MWSVKFALFLLFYASAARGQDTTNSTNSTSEIIDILKYDIGDCGFRYDVNRYENTISHGTATKRNEFPWHVALYKADNVTNIYEYICGGSIIHPRVILTAAHCIYNEALNEVVNEDIVVAIGKYNSSWDSRDLNEKRYKVIGKKIPPTFIGIDNRYADDIALLSLNKSIEFTSLVMPICVDWAQRYEGQNSTSAGTIVGWGLTENKTVSDKLLAAKLQYFDFTTCRAEVGDGFQTFVTSDKFCAGSQSEGGVEKGDSGGGLTFPRTTNHNRSSEQYFIYGILSAKDTTNDVIATFTNVSTHMNWLNRTLKNIIEEIRVREVCGKRFKVNYTDPEDPNKNVTHADYPWVATIILERYNKFFAVRCVANIIHSRAILTSAWCVDRIPGIYYPAKYKVVVGKHILRMEERGQYEQRFNISKIYKHEYYTESDSRSEHELAIVVVDDEIKFNNAVLPICIDWDRKHNLYRHPISVGTIVSWNTKSGHLQETARYHYQTYEECTKEFGETEDYLQYVTYDKVCGKFANGTRFTDNSDVGSGLVFSSNYSTEPDERGDHYVYSIVCNGRPIKEEFITFTNLEKNLRWISDTLDTIF